MEILLILILLTLVYIALQLRKLAKPTVDIDKPLNTTTLTPVFSETEIRENKDLAQTWQEQVKKAFDALGKSNTTRSKNTWKAAARLRTSYRAQSC